MKCQCLTNVESTVIQFTVGMVLATIEIVLNLLYISVILCIQLTGTDLCFSNAMCGKLQCNVDVSNQPTGAQISIEIVQGSRCVNADFNLGTDVLDPGYVKPGSPCDKGKVVVENILMSKFL